MATLTAVAAGGNWGSASTWSPAQTPTAADDCIINASMTGTVTINGTSGSPSLCRSLDCTGCTGTLTITNHVLNIGDGSGGSLTLASGMTFNVSATSLINFVSTTTGNVITTGGQGMPPLTFNGAGGGWTLGDNLSTGDGMVVTLTKGTLNDGGHSVLLRGTVSGGGFSSNNSNTRALTMTGTWTVNFLWDIGTSTGMTLSAGTSTIVIPDQTQTFTFNGGGLTYGTLNCAGLYHNSLLTIAGANTFGALTLLNDAYNTAQVMLAANQTVTGTFTANGNSVLNRLYITSDTKGVSRTISAGTVSVSNIDMQDITGAGAASWNIASVTGGSGDCGRNSGITFTTPITCYMVTGVSVNWSASNWYTTSGGSTPARVPLPQDTARFDSNSFTASGKTVTLDNGIVRFSGMDWTGVTNTPTLALTAVAQFAPLLFGNIVLSSGMSVSGTQTVTLDGAGSNITTNGVTWTGPIDLDCGPGTWTQQDNFTTNQTGSTSLDLLSGTWAMGAHNLTLSGSAGALAVNGSGTLSSTTGTLSITGTSATFIIGTGAVSMQNGTITMAHVGPQLNGGTLIVGTLTCDTFGTSGTDVEIGTGGATYNAFSSITGGSLQATSGNTLKVTATAITVSSAGGGSGGGSWTFC